MTFVLSALAELFATPEEAPAAARVDALEVVEPELLLDAFGEGAVGWKVLFATPNPTSDAKIPPTVTASVLFLLLRTSLPWLSRDAVTRALVATLALIVLMRSATVSVPVDAYVVVLVPSLTVIVPFGGMPRVRSEVPRVSGTVPVPFAGEPDELEGGATEPPADT